jgi:hypothetical protein
MKTKAKTWTSSHMPPTIDRISIMLNQGLIAERGRGEVEQMKTTIKNMGLFPNIPLYDRSDQSHFLHLQHRMTSKKLGVGYRPIAGNCTMLGLPLSGPPLSTV